MKERIKKDTAVLFGIILFTGILFQFPGLYPQNFFLDGILEFLGLGAVLMGTLFRMSGRAHKKARSEQGHGLVTTGPYALIRNPMYLGTFLIGSGFILLVWPWYLWPVFAVLFFLRFHAQIRKEEVYLQKIFGKPYELYTQKTPALIPRWKDGKGLHLHHIFPPEEIWSTKERNAIFFLPLLVVLLEIGQQQIVFGVAPWGRIISVFTIALAAFGLAIFVSLRNDNPA